MLGKIHILLNKEMIRDEKYQAILERQAKLLRELIEISNIKCPFCDYKADISQFKLLRDPWRFRFYKVRMLQCPKCHGVFNHYYGLSSKDKEVKFTVKVKPRK